MKRKILITIFAVVLTFCGCGKEEANQQGKEPVKSENEKEQSGQMNETLDDLEDDDNEVEETLEIYYIDETTGEIALKEEMISGEVSKAIISKLKEAAVVSEECELEVISVNEAEEKLDLAANSGFGDYIRGMGTTGSELVLECVVRTYSEAYDCDGVKITEGGNPLDTGHTVLDGYISYE